MPINATAYIGKRHVCTRIYKFQNGLARFTKRSANSTGKKVKILKYLLFKPWLISSTVRHLSTPLTAVVYRTVPFSKPYTQKDTWAQSIVTAVNRCGVKRMFVYTLIQLLVDAFRDNDYVFYNQIYILYSSTYLRRYLPILLKNIMILLRYHMGVYTPPNIFYLHCKQNVYFLLKLSWCDSIGE